MNETFLQLDFILNIENFEKIQDSIAEVTKLAILTVDFKGIPVTKHSKCSDFCKVMRSNPFYRALCEKCDSRGGLEAVRLQKPFIYLCHMGILDLAIPIIVNKQYFGAVMAGQVLINENEKIQLEQIVNNREMPQDKNIDMKQLEVLRKKLPVISLEKVKAVADMLYHINNYIVEDAYMKIQLNEINQHLVPVDINSNIQKNSRIDNQQYKFNTNNDYNIIVDISDISDNDSRNFQNRLMQKLNIILRPAFDYIQKNFKQNVKLNEMASLCNVSISYFSRLFKKATGKHFASYINEKRITEARKLLESTDLSITNIAIDLGFEDSGYFSKVFRKVVGITPSEFRNMDNTIVNKNS